MAQTTLAERQAKAEQQVRRFTAVAMATGAVPVPAASAAIVAENAAMVTAVGAAMGVEVSVGTVVGALGTMGTVNLLGRAVFLEGARLLAWGAGPFGLAPVCALGAATAGLQTWCLGHLAIALCENGGAPLPSHITAQVLDRARSSFDAFRAERKASEATQ